MVGRGHLTPAGRILKTLALVLLGMAVLGGCRQLDRLSGNTGAPCTSDADCAEGLTCLTDFPGGYCTRETCVEGGCPGFFATCAYLNQDRTVSACVEQCSSDSDCRTDGYSCADLEGVSGCLPTSQATAGVGEIGASCISDADCADGNTCLTNLVFGYCSRSCSTDADCGGEAKCADLGGGASRCLDSCTDNLQCRFGYSCREVNSTPGVCYLADETIGAVRNPSGVPDGDPCVNDIDCQGGTCITGDDFPQGYCSTRSCDVVGCASADATCVNLVTEALCFSNCTDSDDCREGYRCTSLETGGSVCYALSPIRAPDGDATGPIQAQCNAQDLGGNRRQITFDLSSSAIAFSVVPFSPSQSEVVPVQMTLPDGSTFNFENEYSFQTINSLLLGTIVPMLFPAAPQFDNLVQTGTYTFEYETDDAASCFYVIEQPAAGDTLDVNFYLVGVPGITADSAANDSDFQALVNEFDAIYQNANIDIGQVRYFSLSAADEDRYRIIRDFEDVYRLLALTQSPGETRDDALSINVFLIEDFNIDGLPGLLGLSAGIPGVMGVHGNGGAGLVFTSANLSASPQSLGQTMAHEVGHFLGLRHTSERGGADQDPLDDTPFCSSPEDPYSCPDVNNLMFPFSVDVDQRGITDDQRFVLQRNPLVK